ncbi:hypothetical protein ILUMI_20597 [Ignelater luminosus]|uniref:Major facilitator superfamily (MFS) profile domain-containing protein n=1 Tax=Ignelater luminosus TaxID=2038154 RepID=A0A8K0CG36_IGNLU|nr:hypothetical protein ILUMI_20597 [Ignelater luminosus]
MKYLYVERRLSVSIFSYSLVIDCDVCVPLMMKKEVPDGGWGWMIVLGAAVANLVNQSLFSQFGLIYGDKLKEMGHGTIGAALVMNINSMVTNFSGLITGPVLKNYSVRKIALVGVILTASGMIFSSFATNIVHLIISYSVFTGLGLGLIMPSTFVAVNEYFSTRKSQAVGLSMAGTGVGQMLMPQVVRFLLDEYGYQGTTLVLGALCLNGLPGALLFHPVKWHMKVVDVEGCAEKKHLLVKNIKIEQTDSQQENEETNSKTVKSSDKKDRAFFQRIATLLNLELLRDFQFIHILLGLSLVYTCSVAFSMLFPFFLQDDIGLTRSDTALAMSILSGADILSRLTLPLVTRYFHVNSRMTFLIGTACLAACRSLLAQQTTLELIILMAILCGYTRAAVVINQNLTVSEYCSETSKLPGALGLNMVAKGIVVLSVGQMFGWVRDYFQSFILCIHVQSTVMLLVVLTWSVDILINKLCFKKSLIAS